MGLVGIHDPDALCHFNGLTHCPWCGKEGQNEGKVVKHLWTVHYRHQPGVCQMLQLLINLIRHSLLHYGWQNWSTLRGGRPQ